MQIRPRRKPQDFMEIFQIANPGLRTISRHETIQIEIVRKRSNIFYKDKSREDAAISHCLKQTTFGRWCKKRGKS